MKCFLTAKKKIKKHKFSVLNKLYTLFVQIVSSKLLSAWKTKDQKSNAIWFQENTLVVLMEKWKTLSGVLPNIFELD
jgi:tetrahydrodipicolinate N-succinyltransferase